MDLPADVDVPVVASAPERIWLWSDLYLSAPSVLLGWCRPFRSVEQMKRYLTGTGSRWIGSGAPLRFELCRAIRRVLREGTLDVELTSPDHS